MALRSLSAACTLSWSLSSGGTAEPARSSTLQFSSAEPARSSTLQFSSASATDLQPLFSQSSVGSNAFLGGDVCTSIPLDDVGRSYLYLHGDTLIGRFLPNGTRVIAAMPRNSVGVLYTDGAGWPLSTMSHSWRVDPGSQHVGFFSPPEDVTQWYWPTAGTRVRNTTYVVSMRMLDAGSGEFPFSLAGFDVITLPQDADGTRFADPMDWPASLATVTIGKYVGDNFSVGNAVTYVAEEDALYLLGSWKGPRSPASNSAILARITAASWVAQTFATDLTFLLSNGSWAPHYDSIGDDLELLFSVDVPSETTMTWVPAISAWAILIANTFLYSSVMMRTAPSLTGPWADAVPLYEIPSFMSGNGSFCYAGKMHDEFAAPDSFVFSYNCNVQGFPPLLDRPEIYTPQLIRTTITGS
jgi:hypothetical protein